jgi:3'(2'), 5'-bisphosphate nucleotidase
VNDHELARHAARVAGDLLSGLQEFAKTLPVSADPYELALAREVLGRQGDETGQQALATLLQTHRPADVVLSEEAPDDAARLGAQRVWIIDPLDGTTQYATGNPDYAVQVALWERGSAEPGGITAAAVYLPSFQVMLGMDDAVELGPVDRGTVRILVSRSRPPDDLPSIVARIQHALGRPVEVFPFGSVGAKVAQIINGAADIYLSTGSFSEWDVAAPLGVAEHYGIAVRTLTGDLLQFNQPNTGVPGAIVARAEYLAPVVEALA